MNDLAYWRELDSAVKSGLGLLVVLAALLAAASTSPQRLAATCRSSPVFQAAPVNPIHPCHALPST